MFIVYCYQLKKTQIQSRLHVNLRIKFFALHVLLTYKTHHYLLENQYIVQNTQKKITILDVNFPTINLNDVVVIVAYIKDKHDCELGIRAYNTSLNFLKHYIVEFGHSDIEFASLFKTDKLLTPINTELEEIDLLSEAPITDPKKYMWAPR